MGRKKPTFGELLIRSAREAVAIERGEMAPARATRYRITARAAVVAPPPPYDASRIRAVRERMDVSQSVFAQALNVSPETVRAWEQGKRTPEGPTLRLLEVAEHQPGVLLRNVQPRPAARTRKKPAR